MRIEDEIKLTFDDVLIRPKRSTLVSRSEVQLEGRLAGMSLIVRRRLAR